MLQRAGQRGDRRQDSAGCHPGGLHKPHALRMVRRAWDENPGAQNAQKHCLGRPAQGRSRMLQWDATSGWLGPRGALRCLLAVAHMLCPQLPTLTIAHDCQPGVGELATFLQVPLLILGHARVQARRGGAVRARPGGVLPERTLLHIHLRACAFAIHAGFLGTVCHACCCPRMVLLLSTHVVLRLSARCCCCQRMCAQAAEPDARDRKKIKAAWQRHLRGHGWLKKPMAETAKP